MFIQFRHVEANELFYYLPSFISVQYKKTNHNRGRVIRQTGVPYKGKPLYRRFKPNDIVLTEAKSTSETEWMEVKK